MMNYEPQQHQQYEEGSQPFYESGYQQEASREQSVSTPKPAIHSEQPSNSYQYQLLPQRTLDDGSIAISIFSYMMGWFSGLIVFLFAGQNRYARFHALQSLLFFGAINLLDMLMLVSARSW